MTVASVLITPAEQMETKRAKKATAANFMAAIGGLGTLKTLVQWLGDEFLSFFLPCFILFD